MFAACCYLLKGNKLGRGLLLRQFKFAWAVLTEAGSPPVLHEGARKVNAYRKGLTSSWRISCNVFIVPTDISCFTYADFVPFFSWRKLKILFSCMKEIKFHFCFPYLGPEPLCSFYIKFWERRFPSIEQSIIGSLVMTSFPCNSSTLEPTLTNKLTVILAAETFLQKMKHFYYECYFKIWSKYHNVLKHKLNFLVSYILHNNNLKRF